MRKISIFGANDKYILYPNQPNLNYDLDLRSGKSLICFREFDGKRFIAKHQKFSQNKNINLLLFHHEKLLSFNSENIAKTIELIVQNEHLFLIKELVEGKSLKSFNKDYNFRSSNRTLEILILFKEILKIINVFHSKNVIVVDLKPSNIIIQNFISNLKNTKVKCSINDYGLAVSNNFVPANNSKIQYSLYYSSPEASLGFYDLINTYSDVYSVGMLLTETLLGYHPYKLKHPGMVIEHQFSQNIKFSNHIPNCVTEILKKTTFKKLTEKPLRFSSYNEKLDLTLKSIEGRTKTTEEFINSLDEAIESISKAKKRYSFNIYEPLKINISSEKAVLVFDYSCVFCNKMVDFIKSKDKKSLFRFTHNKSDYFETLTNNESYKLSKDYAVLVYKQKIYIKSDAILKALVLLGGFYKSNYMLYIFPKFIRNIIYNLIAKNRHNISGSNLTCKQIPVYEKHLFID